MKLEDRTEKPLAIHQRSPASHAVFTLILLLVVIAIIAILSGLRLPYRASSSTPRNQMPALPR